MKCQTFIVRLKTFCHKIRSVSRS